jgi:deoxycytidylate deaminase
MRLLLAAGIREVRYLQDYKNDPLVTYLAGKMGVPLRKMESEAREAREEKAGDGGNKN